MYNSKKLATLGKLDTRHDRQSKEDYTICVGHHYAKANTNNVNKT
jgi:hypothetical protein